MRLSKRVALVTGAGSGIGRALALAFAREGATVAAADVHVDAARGTAADIEAAHGRALALDMDVTDPVQVERGVAAIVDAYGPPDLLVSNAGIQIEKPLVDLTFDEWRRILAVHLDGAFLTTRACLPHMYRARRGAILYMGSVHSMLAWPNKSAYVTAKHGLLGLCRVVAQEGAAHGVRANILCPGFVRTPLIEGRLEHRAEELHRSVEETARSVFLRDTVDGEFTATADLAELAITFAAFPTLALTGQSLVVSHGWLLD